MRSSYLLTGNAIALGASFLNDLSEMARVAILLGSIVVTVQTIAINQRRWREIRKFRAAMKQASQTAQNGKRSKTL